VRVAQVFQGVELIIIHNDLLLGAFVDFRFYRPLADVTANRKSLLLDELLLVLFHLILLGFILGNLSLVILLLYLLFQILLASIFDLFDHILSFVVDSHLTLFNHIIKSHFYLSE
jgi:hypothetical protein